MSGDILTYGRFERARHKQCHVLNNHTAVVYAAVNVKFEHVNKLAIIVNYYTYTDVQPVRLMSNTGDRSPMEKSLLQVVPIGPMVKDARPRNVCQVANYNIFLRIRFF